MGFDINGARQAGYSDDEIADHLAKQSGFDAQGARKSGYKSAEIIQHLSGAAPTSPEQPHESPGMLTSFLAGAGQRFGNTVLGGQKLLGKGLVAADELMNGKSLQSVVTGKPSTMLGRGGQWLVNDAEHGQADLQAQNAPYHEANPISNSAGSIASDLVVTAPVGGLLSKGIASVATKAGPAAPVLQKLATAVQTGGMSTGGKIPLTMAEKATDLGLRAAGGAINGGASTAIVSPDDTGTGALVGGTFPVAVAGAGNLGRAVGAAFTKAGGKRAAVENIATEVGRDNIPQIIGDIQTHYPKGAESIPLTAAAVTQNPTLARMEQASRLRTAPVWYDFDQTQGRAVYDNVLKATADAKDLGDRFANRAANWAKNWAAAEDKTKPRVWVKRMGQLGSDIEQALMSPEASDPAVRRTVEELRNEVMRVGPSFSPAHLQKIRAQFNGRAQPMDPSAFKSAPRENPAIQSLVAELDDILNQTTGGRWDKVKQGYATDTAQVHAAKASQQIRDKFVDQQTGRVRGVSLDPNGDIPKITETGLGRAMDAARLPNRRLALDPAAEQRLSATLDALRSQGIVQGMKRSASAGGGSDTMGNALALSGGESGPWKSALAQAMAAIGKAATANKANATAQLFTNPDELAKALDAINRPVLPGSFRPIPYQVAPLIATDR